MVHTVLIPLIPATILVNTTRPYLLAEVPVEPGCTRGDMLLWALVLAAAFVHSARWIRRVRRGM